MIFFETHPLGVAENVFAEHLFIFIKIVHELPQWKVNACRQIVGIISKLLEFDERDDLLAYCKQQDIVGNDQHLDGIDTGRIEKVNY